MKAKLMSLSIYKDILETEPVKCLLRICDAESPDVLIRSYSDLIYSVYSSGFSNLSEYIAWHLKYDRSFVGTAVATGSASQALLDAAAMDIRRLSGISQLACAGLKRTINGNSRSRRSLRATAAAAAGSSPWARPSTGRRGASTGSSAPTPSTRI